MCGTESTYSARSNTCRALSLLQQPTIWRMKSCVFLFDPHMAATAHLWPHQSLHLLLHCCCVHVCPAGHCLQGQTAGCHRGRSWALCVRHAVCCRYFYAPAAALLRLPRTRPQHVGVDVPCQLACAAVLTLLSSTRTFYPRLWMPSACLLFRFVAVEWGAMSYPSFTVQRTRPVFSSRQQVLQYEQALALAGRVDAALEVCLCLSGEKEEFCSSSTQHSSTRPASVCCKCGCVLHNDRELMQSSSKVTGCCIH